MKVLFMGTPAFAAESLAALLDAGHDVRAAVTRPDAPSGRGLSRRSPAVKELALARGVPTLQPEEVKGDLFAQQVAELGADIIVVVAFGRILPQRLLEAAPLGAVNVHASLLPRLRGASPIVWAIARGEPLTGVTTMRMVRKLDAGDILMQSETPIQPEETAGQLESRLARLGGDLLVRTLTGLQAGSIKPRPQDESAVTWAPMLRKEDGLIEWSRSAREIARLVRAFDPWPAARTGLPDGSGRQFRLWKAAEDPGATAPGAAGPGTIVGTDDGILVCCGQGTMLRVTELQPDGRKRMSAQAALAGRYLGPGDRFG
ncbi:MAG TPA: methionyl-tRNA formyltransferase [Patescibacteria group bacterium]|jgi:methionyl-tRNA formyltransferase|nr:methionyl-tRNA formyltransferase [Patescibacteria group bacterium]